MTTIRHPTVAGQFYPSTKQQLTQQITACFLDPRGPGSLPQHDNQKPPIKALIVPHAGYQYSGPIAAHAYHSLATHGFADTFIIIGPNHTGTGTGVALMNHGLWQTPLGTIPTNTDLANKLHTGIIDLDDQAHQYEHSLEVQLPFLQYLQQKEQPVDFVPICMLMQDYETAHEIGTIIATTLQYYHKNVVIIASTDFSHVGFNYQTIPPSAQRVDHYATNQDKKALEQIQHLNPQGLIDTVHQHHISMCGYGPVAATITAAQQLGATTAQLLHYGTSYAVHPSNSCVGYAAISIT